MTILDTSELRALAVDLGNASREVEREAERVLEKGALNVKDKMAADAKAAHGGYAKHFHRSISYDRATRAGQLGFEIGPDKHRRQGALGNLLYFGSANNGPTLDIEAGLIEEEPRLVSEMGKMLERVLGA